MTIKHTHNQLCAKIFGKEGKKKWSRFKWSSSLPKFVAWATASWQVLETGEIYFMKKMGNYGWVGLQMHASPFVLIRLPSRMRLLGDAQTQQLTQEKKFTPVLDAAWVTGNLCKHNGHLRDIFRSWIGDHFASWSAISWSRSFYLGSVSRNRYRMTLGPISAC